MGMRINNIVLPKTAPPDRLWGIGGGVKEGKPVVLVSVGDVEVGLNSRGVADFAVALLAAFDISFPAEFSHLQKRMAKILAMEE